MSNRACKAAVCCSAVSAKISKIDDLILARFIVDEDVLDLIIEMGERFDKEITEFVDEQFRDS